MQAQPPRRAEESDVATQAHAAVADPCAQRLCGIFDHQARARATSQAVRHRRCARRGGWAGSPASVRRPGARAVPDQSRNGHAGYRTAARAGRGCAPRSAPADRYRPAGSRYRAWARLRRVRSAISSAWVPEQVSCSGGVPSWWPGCRAGRRRRKSLACIGRPAVGGSSRANRLIAARSRSAVRAVRIIRFGAAEADDASHDQYRNRQGGAGSAALSAARPTAAAHRSPPGARPRTPGRSAHGAAGSSR